MNKIQKLTQTIRNYAECELDYGALKTLKMIDDESIQMNQLSTCKTNQDALLVEVQRLGELLEMMDKYMPDESSTLGELYHRSMKQYNKVNTYIKE